MRVWCDMRCSCSKYSPAPGVEPGSWHLRFRSASVRAHLTGWMWMGHLAPFKLAQGGTAPGGGCYWESRPSCRTRSLKYLPEQMCVDEITLTSAAAAAAAEVPVAPGAQGDYTRQRRGRMTGRPIWYRRMTQQRRRTMKINCECKEAQAAPKVALWTVPQRLN